MGVNLAYLKLIKRAPIAPIFVKGEENFIVKQFHLGKSSIEVKYTFRHEFGQLNQINPISPRHFKNVFLTFEKNGIKKVNKYDFICDFTHFFKYFVKKMN